MNDRLYEKISQNPAFQQLVAARDRFAWTLSSIILILYLGFILLIAFAPGVLGTRISADSPITWGIPFGIGLILISFILTGIYVKRANTVFDEINDAILREARQ